MPCIAEFYGISIYVNYRDHNPPHFHAYYGEFAAQILIENGEILAGKLPNRALRMIREWSRDHHAELTQVWQLARENQPLPRIEPLD